MAENENQIGQVTGLAWTEVGGELLTIECANMPGKGNILRTGSLGDVMKESVEAARSVVRARARRLGIRDEAFEKTDIHIHVPEGATPKDGPSAGITMTTALVSAYTGIPVRCDVCMTGAVSYTHLDVYKRQAISCSSGRPDPARPCSPRPSPACSTCLS